MDARSSGVKMVHSWNPRPHCSAPALTRLTTHCCLFFRAGGGGCNCCGSILNADSEWFWRGTEVYDGAGVAVVRCGKRGVKAALYALVGIWSHTRSGLTVNALVSDMEKLRHAKRFGGSTLPNSASATARWRDGLRVDQSLG